MQMFEVPKYGTIQRTIMFDKIVEIIGTFFILAWVVLYLFVILYCIYDLINDLTKKLRK